MASAEQQQHLFNFDRDLDRFARALQIELVTLMKKIGFDLLARIVSRTPVDTGRARASWVITIGDPSETVAPPGEHKSYQTGDAPSPPAGVAAVDAAGGVLANVGPYDDIWISNNLPYIERLEHGHSGQAPEGMVALAIQETETELDVAIREVP